MELHTSMFRYLALLSCALGFSPALALANTINAHPCFACDDAAFQTAAASRGEGVHHIYDFHSGQIRGFEVVRELDLMPGAVVFVAMEIPVSAGHRGYFEELAQVRALLGDLSSITVPVTVGPNAPIYGFTAYEVVRQPGLRLDISDWLRTQANSIFTEAGLPGHTGSLLASLLQRIDRVATQGELLKIQVRIVLADGSSVVFEFSGNNLVDGEPEFVPGSARDVNNQPVLEPGQSLPNGTEFGFRHNNSAEEINRWLNHMCSLVPCVRPGDLGRVRACVIIDGQVTCTTI